MKISKILMFSFLLLCLVLPYITMAHAAEKPKYVGIDEGQTIIWNTTFDKDPLEEFYEDNGITNEDAIDLFVDGIFDPLEWDKDVVAWKVIVNEIKEEDDEDVDGGVDDEDDVNFVKVEIAIYETEDKSDSEAWDDIDKNERVKIYEPEEVAYANIAYDTGGVKGMFFQTSDPIPEDEWPLFFVPKNLKWDTVADDCDEQLEDDHYDDDYSINTAKVDYFFQKKSVGIENNAEGDGDVEDFDSVNKYTDNGVLYYYEWMYDGDTIAKFELDSIGGVYLIENWWWIALIAGAVIIAVIIIVVVVASKRK